MKYEELKTKEIKPLLLAAMRAGDEVVVDKIRKVLVERAARMGIFLEDIKPSKKAMEEYKREVLDEIKKAETSLR